MKFIMCTHIHTYVYIWKMILLIYCVDFVEYGRDNNQNEKYLDIMCIYMKRKDINKI